MLRSTVEYCTVDFRKCVYRLLSEANADGVPIALGLPLVDVDDGDGAAAEEAAPCCPPEAYTGLSKW